MHLIDRVLYGADQQVADFVAARIPSVAERGWPKDYTALGVVIDHKLVGGIVFTNCHATPDLGIYDIEMSGAFDDPRWCLPQTLARLFSYPFVQVGCVRMTTITGASNARARRLDERLGFVQEGVIRKGLDGVEDAIVYGMLREECRWLNKGK